MRHNGLKQGDLNNMDLTASYYFIKKLNSEIENAGGGMMFHLSEPDGDEEEEESSGETGGGIGAMEVVSASVSVFGLGNTVRYFLELEYLKQARINRALSGNFEQPIKHSLRTTRGIGTGTTILGAGFGIASFMMSDQSWGDYGQLGVSLLSTGLTFGGTTAPIGIGLGAVDAFGGLNGFYNYLDAQQNFYNSTGGILVPINGFPSFILLK